MDERMERAARNEALFRDVNERVAEAAEGFHLELFDALCECHDPACMTPIRITVPEYEALRAHPARFALVDGHEEPGLEEVVERNERFVVVAKLGGGADLARELDPRSD
jgi:hypothetical protein